MTEPVVPTLEAWQRVSEAVKLVEAGRSGYNQLGREPLYHLPARVIKITGAVSSGYYPAVILAWDEDAEDWVETEECYVKQE